jgi:hypothetical protein
MTLRLAKRNPSMYVVFVSYLFQTVFSKSNYLITFTYLYA